MRCFDAVGWASGRAEWWDAGMVMRLGQGADLHMAQLMPLPFTVSCSSKSRLILPSWFYLFVPAHPGSPRQNPENRKMLVVVV